MTSISFLAVNDCFFSGINFLIDAFSVVEKWVQHKSGDRATRLFNMEIITADGNPIIANGGIPIQPGRSLSELENPDLVLIPGIQTLSPPFAEHQELILEQLLQLHSRHVKIAAGCTGVFLLAASGLLDGKQATTNWRFSRLFERQFPKVNLKIGELLTEDSGLICTGATSASLNLALYIIRSYCSETIAQASSKLLLIDPNRESQSPYIIFDPSDDHGDRDVAKAQQLMKSSYGQPLTIEEVANHVNISSRHFKRRFKQATGESPLHYLQRIRIEAGKSRLETTRESINEITHQIGYEDSSTFRRLFKKQVGLSPREYRDKFFIAKLN